MRFRPLSLGLLVVGAVLLAVALVGACWPRDEPGVYVQGPAVPLPALERGRPVDAAVVVRNPTRHAARVIGLAANCEDNCKLQILQEVPFDLLPGAAEEVKCTLLPMKSDPSEAELQVFVEEAGLRQLTALIRVEVVFGGPDDK
jgi:hypothetical protein